MGFDIGNIGNTALGAASTVKDWQSGNKLGALERGASTIAQSGLPGSQWLNNNVITPVAGIANNVRGIQDAASFLMPQQHQLLKTA